MIEPETKNQPGGGELKIQNDFEEEVKVDVNKKRPDLIKPSEDQTAKISLQDCLACTGCVTSAETVLI